MSDEEKKAIERAEFLIKIDTYLEKEMLTNLLNLIEKQSKEIEELNAQRLREISNTKYWVSKDKIKAKIEVMNTNIVNAKKFDCDYIGQCRFAKYVLQSLLEKE